MPFRLTQLVRDVVSMNFVFHTRICTVFFLKASVCVPSLATFLRARLLSLTHVAPSLAPSMPSGEASASPPQPPLWHHACFQPIFLEQYIETGSDTPPIGDAFALASQLIAGLAALLPQDSAVQAAALLCADAERTSPALVTSVTGEPFYEFLAKFVGRVRALQPGQVVITPGFWRAACGLLLVLGRSSGGDYTLAVCNTGDGARYHPARADPILRDVRVPTLVFRGLSVARVGDSSFWCALFHSVLHRGTAVLYERLLPYASQRPLAAAYPDTDPHARVAPAVAAIGRECASAPASGASAAASAAALSSAAAVAGASEVGASGWPSHPVQAEVPIS